MKATVPLAHLIIVLFFLLFSCYQHKINADDSESESNEGCGCSGKNGLTRDTSFARNIPNYSTCNSGIELRIDGEIDENSFMSLDVDSTISTHESNHYNEMIYIEGGSFFMGTDNPIIKGDGEGPKRPVTVSSFYIDKYEVSNTDYRRFVTQTNYRTESELFGWSFVFESAINPKLKENITQAVLGAEWWLPVNNSYWRFPEGPNTDVFETNRSNHPVVQISWNDAKKYCLWKGGRLPTEAEWEYAAYGSVKKRSSGAMFPWGNKFLPGGEYKANIFQGTFPEHNTVEDKYEFLAPVDAFGPQNDYDLYNMIGNAWEWVEDWFTIDHQTASGEGNYIVNPRGPLEGTEKVKKGGSFLCHRSFCYRYRIAARYATTPDSATLNSGFRCARNSND